METFRTAVAAAIFSVTSFVAGASPVSDIGFPMDPGPAFDWPAVYNGFNWTVDLTAVTSAPTTIVDFTVTNTTSDPVMIGVFQVFGEFIDPDLGWTCSHLDFDLQINGTATPWTMIVPDQCLYHNYENFVLVPGPTQFSIVWTGTPLPGGTTQADVRFGNVIPAVPLPAGAVLSLTALTALGWAGRRQRPARD